ANNLAADSGGGDGGHGQGCPGEQLQQPLLFRGAGQGAVRQAEAVASQAPALDLDGGKRLPLAQQGGQDGGEGVAHRVLVVVARPAVELQQWRGDQGRCVQYRDNGFEFVGQLGR